MFTNQFWSSFCFSSHPSQPSLFLKIQIIPQSNPKCGVLNIDEEFCDPIIGFMWSRCTKQDSRQNWTILAYANWRIQYLFISLGFLEKKKTLQVFHFLCYEDQKLKLMSTCCPSVPVLMLFRNDIHLIGIMTEMPLTMN